jgi:hypothetical protein
MGVKNIVFLIYFKNFGFLTGVLQEMVTNLCAMNATFVTKHLYEVSCAQA